RDVAEAIAVGVTLGSLLFMHRMAGVVEDAMHTRLVDDDVPDVIGGPDTAHEFDARGIAVLSLRGPLFFGAAGQVSSVLDQIGEKPRGFVLDLSRVPFVDETAAHALIAFFGKAQKRGVRVAVAGVQRPVLRTLLQNGLDRRMVIMAPDVDAARKRLSITVDKALAQGA
ncbi:MAG: sodium-independent anion transporter, partial [Hyphomicrobiales bacterium]|nr:sodium-independent anion transporter [Hyphomicrobiales bacterium]